MQLMPRNTATITRWITVAPTSSFLRYLTLAKPQNSGDLKSFLVLDFRLVRFSDSIVIQGTLVEIGSGLPCIVSIVNE